MLGMTCLALGMAALPQAALAAQSFSLTAIGAADQHATVKDINDLGQLVGDFRVRNPVWAPRIDPESGYPYPDDLDYEFERHPFLFANGQFTDLGVLERVPYRQSSYGYATATSINNAGQIVGISDVSVTTTDSRGGKGPVQAFIYQNGKMSNLGLSSSIYSSTTASSINDKGNVAGYRGEVDSYGHDGREGLLAVNGTLTRLPVYPSAAFAINEKDQVTGSIAVEVGAWSNRDEAFLYDHGQMTALGTLGGTHSEGFALNDRGQVTGTSSTASQQDWDGHAFLYSDGVMTDLTPDAQGSRSAGRDINEDGVVVGEMGIGGPSEGHAFMYKDGKLIDLNSLIDPNLGWTLTKAVAINDGGIIVGQGRLNGESRAFMLTPVPEPETWGLALAGLALLGVIGSGKRAGQGATKLR